MTADRYCLVNDPTNQYVYTPARVKKIVREVGTVQKFQAFFGYPPRDRPSTWQKGSTGRAVWRAQLNWPTRRRGSLNAVVGRGSWH